MFSKIRNGILLSVLAAVGVDLTILDGSPGELIDFVRGAPSDSVQMPTHLSTNPIFTDPVCAGTQLAGMLMNGAEHVALGSGVITYGDTHSGS